LRESGVRPAKALGQHFLSDRNVVSKIVAAAELTPEDVVIEVGPGLGVLTERLVEAAGRVIAVELDRGLASRLRERFAADPRLTVIDSDVLSRSPDALLGAAGLPASVPYVVVGNLPYNAGTAIMRHVLEAARPPTRLIVMLQREVAAAIVAAPGELSLLGVSIQVYARPRRLFNVPARAFYPPPKVVSSVLRLDVREEPLVPASERNHFFAVVRAGFSAPRKQLRNSLAQGLTRPVPTVLPAIEAAGIDPTVRPEDLSVDQWLRLARTVEA
jgi:16S rRNA (adenine1518-N6/adenine1519-N6)-dimethyltransferase